MSASRRQSFPTCSASLLLAIGILFPAAALRAAGPVLAWVQRYPGAEGTKIAVDPDGNVVVAGNIGSYGPGLVIKYSSSGVALWTNLWQGAWGGLVEDMALSTNGNVYVTGYASVMIKAPSDCLTIGYSSAGTPIWTNTYNGSANLDDRASSVAVDRSGNVYVSGYSRRNGAYRSYVTLAYSNSGTPMWTNLYSAEPWSTFTDCFAVAMTVDDAGNVYVLGHDDELQEGPAPGYGIVAYSSTGASLWTNHCGGCISTPFAIAASRNGNVYVAREPNGGGYLTSAYSNGGALLWAKWYSAGFPPADYPDSVAIGSNGNVYVTGYSRGGGTGYDYATLAYSNTGTPLWTNRYDGPGHTNDYAQALAVGSDGTVYVTGYSWGADSFYDYLTLAYSSGGVPLWTNRYNGPANGYDQAFAMAVDGSGNIYITGYSQGDCTTIKYAPAPPILFSAIDLVPGPACRLTITAPTNLSYRLEASTNLANWLTLTNYTNLPATSIQYTDPLAPGFPGRFYRAVWAP